MTRFDGTYNVDGTKSGAPSYRKAGSDETVERNGGKWYFCVDYGSSCYYKQTSGGDKPPERGWERASQGEGSPPSLKYTGGTEASASPAVLAVGDRVALRPGAEQRGCLRDGRVGTLVEDDGSGLPYKCEYNGDTHWYPAADVVAAGSGAGGASSNDDGAGRLSVGDKVKLSAGYGAEGDADGGPLKPGNCLAQLSRLAALLHSKTAGKLRARVVLRPCSTTATS
jgi:hypothetical protein